MNTKLLALKRLGIKPAFNRSLTAAEKPFNFEGGGTGRGLKEIQTGSIPINRHSYHFMLKDDEGGGTYLTDAPDLESVRHSLLGRYGDRLLLVAKS